MTAHELAKALLQGPDLPVVIIADSEEAPTRYDEATSTDHVFMRYCKADGNTIVKEDVVWIN